MECVETFKGEYDLQASSRSRKPTLLKQLYTFVKFIWQLTPTEVDVHLMGTGYVENKEVQQGRNWHGAATTIVSKLNSQAESTEGCLLKEMAIPFLMWH